MDQYPSYWMWARRDLRGYPRSHSKPGDSWDQEQAFAEDSSLALGGSVWPPRSYTCSFCRREFRSAQALGGHMNVHRRDRARLKQSSDNTVEDQAGSTDQYHHQHAVQQQYPLFADVGLEYPHQICTKNEVSDNTCKNMTLVSPAYTFGGSNIVSEVQQEISTHQRNLLSFMSGNRVADSKHDHVEDSRPVVRDDQFVYNQVQKDGIESHCLLDSFRKRKQRSVVEDEVIEEDEDRAMHIRRRIDLSLSVSNFLNGHYNLNSDKRSRQEQSLLCFLEQSSSVGQHLQSELVAAPQSHESSSENLDLELRLGGSRPKVN